MYSIYQGGNEPIHIRFRDDANSFSYISAGLYSRNLSSNGICVKRWDKSDMTISGSDVRLPITQAESQTFTKGKAKLLIKYRKGVSPIEIVKEIDVMIVERDDKDILLGDN